MTKQQFRGTESTWPVILEMLPVGGGIVLDAGCGEHEWKRRNWTIARCDSGQEYVGGRQLDGVDKIDLNLDWPYEDNQFDGIIAADVVEHLENMWHFFREAFRVSRNFVIISTPHVESDMSATMFRKYRRLWGFHPPEIEKSGHLTPIFKWQLHVVEQRSDGWRIADVQYAHHPIKTRVAKRWGLEKYVGVMQNNRTLVVKFVPEVPDVA